MKAKKAVAMLAMMAACTATDTAKVSYRDVAKPITSVALFDPARFSGPWEVVASYQGSLCYLEVVALEAGDMEIVQNLCNGSHSDIRARISGPGRFLAKTGWSAGLEHWVMWVDQSYRVAVIGTMNGEFGMILSRNPDIPADRLAAAREILDWNGYDLSRLKMRPLEE